MSDNINQPRRTFIKIGGVAAAMIPIAALAAKNDAMRSATKYVEKSPDPAKTCTNCFHFKAPNGCALYPGDTEINPNGYCISWVKKP
ncbi:MAG: high-potential iron-sulfur protein [Burkholderiaceae bacterium]|jgi:anaerobic selenocysteine-containing dehydrogenase|nr:high-potential iron-sulfur protein [Burkholderiaceae bacterium]